MERTHIIILNWNGGEDTWKCVRSVCMLPDVRITIVDNASTDDSVSFLQTQLRETGIDYALISAEEVSSLAGLPQQTSIVLSSQNLGFAKGINLVLRPLLEAESEAFVWLLNNDAIAGPDTLAPLIAALRADMNIAFAGSAIMDARRHDEVQCFGVRYYKWLGVGKMLFKGRAWDSISGQELAAAPPDFQHGASLLVRMDAIRKIGLLDERFFLYSEEHDWQQRGSKAGLRNARVPESKVYHLGSMSTARSRHLFYYYYSSSSVIFARKHHPGFTAGVATVMLSLITVIRTRLHPKSMRWALKGIREAWKIPL